MKKYPNPLSLKCKSICRCYTAVLTQILSARTSVSHGWMQDPFIFNLTSMDENGGMMEDPVEIKTSRKIKINFHLMQLDTFWCMQLNVSPQLAKAALKVLVPFATNNIRQSSFSSLLHLKSKTRNLSEPDEDMRVATSNKELHCSMIVEKNNKRDMFDCWCTLLQIHCIVISLQNVLVSIAI